MDYNRDIVPPGLGQCNSSGMPISANNYVRTSAASLSCASMHSPANSRTIIQLSNVNIFGCPSIAIYDYGRPKGYQRLSLSPLARTMARQHLSQAGTRVTCADSQVNLPLMAASGWLMIACSVAILGWAVLSVVFPRPGPIRVTRPWLRLGLLSRMSTPGPAIIHI